MRVALCQLNPTVGDLAGNAALVERAAKEAHAGGAELAVFPELVISGYPPQDLLGHEAFVRAAKAQVDRLAKALPPGLVALVGFPERKSSGAGRRVHNSVAVITGGKVASIVQKRLLPTYDVFDEDRHFEPGAPSALVRVGERRVGVTVCEDAWNDAGSRVAKRQYDANPVADVVALGASILVNVSASPFTLEKRAARAEMFAKIAKKRKMPLVFVNQVGGNDDLLFDGSSALFGVDGKVIARAAAYREEIVIADTATGGTVAAESESDELAAYDALVMGVRDYAQKCGFKTAVLGLSGGIDSALTAAIAVDALGKENVSGVAMPTRYSSKGSVDDARSLAEALGIAFRVIDIDPVFAAHLANLGPALEAFGTAPPNDVTFENIQARVRCATLMAISNRTGALLLTTGNKSEIAVGYCTLYGDMAGGLAVISDLPKTFVYRVARAYNARKGSAVIPESTLTKAPSAELRPNQTDQDSLPPYEVLDPVIERLVEGAESADEVVAAGFDRAVVERVAKLLRQSEYKRRQMPPGLIVTGKAFGPGRRYPIAQRWLG
jgi:NAD+ synthase (glutamine-hydrolysing)